MKIRQTRYLPKHVREIVARRDKNTCQYCGRPYLYGKARTLDHVVPFSVDTGNYLSTNYVVACASCNSRRNKRPIQVYVKARLVELDREREALLRIASRFPDK